MEIIFSVAPNQMLLTFPQLRGDPEDSSGPGGKEEGAEVMFGGAPNQMLFASPLLRCFRGLPNTRSGRELMLPTLPLPPRTTWAREGIERGERWRREGFRTRCSLPLHACAVIPRFSEQ